MFGTIFKLFLKSVLVKRKMVRGLIVIYIIDNRYLEKLKTHKKNFAEFVNQINIKIIFMKNCKCMILILI